MEAEIAAAGEAEAALASQAAAAREREAKAKARAAARQAELSETAPQVEETERVLLRTRSSRLEVRSILGHDAACERRPIRTCAAASAA
eukprot:1513124-Prymnesium_polylepis.3